MYRTDNQSETEYIGRLERERANMLSTAEYRDEQAEWFEHFGATVNPVHHLAKPGAWLLAAGVILTAAILIGVNNVFPAYFDDRTWSEMASQLLGAFGGGGVLVSFIWLCGRIGDLTDWEDDAHSQRERANDYREYAEQLETDLARAVARRDERREFEQTVTAIPKVIGALGDVVADAEEDWVTTNAGARMYAVIRGFDNLDEVAQDHGWDELTVAKIREARAAYAAVTSTLAVNS